MNRKEKVLALIQKLKKTYPNAKIELDFENPFQLLIATILSAQATDVSVNLASPALFKKYPTPQDLAKAPMEEIDSYIKKINFHSNKAKLIKNCATTLLAEFEGKVPDNMEDLITLPGIGRKGANVVLGSAFGKAEGIVVDTHMIRMSNKLGLTESKDPVQIEKDLMEIVPKQHWIDFPLMLILHGRHFCTARPHTCEDCPLEELCPDFSPSLRGTK